MTDELIAEISATLTFYSRGHNIPKTEKYIKKLHGGREFILQRTHTHAAIVEATECKFCTDQGQRARDLLEKLQK